MLPGGSGDVGIERGGDIRHDNNFVVRSRGLWAARGYAVLIPDAIDGANLRGQRSGAQYGQLAADLIAYARSSIVPLAVLPVFLLGTSQGSIAAMNGAAHAVTGTLAGVVLTESVAVMGGSHETVFSANPDRVRVPALIVANTNDRCDVAPPAMAPRIAAAMSNSPNVEVKMISGGETKSAKACGSLTPHGYYGIEDRVVDLISAWMQARLNITVMPVPVTGIYVLVLATFRTWIAGTFNVKTALARLLSGHDEESALIPLHPRGAGTHRVVVPLESQRFFAEHIGFETPPRL